MIGSKEAIMHLSMTYLQEGDEVLVPDPGYPTYRAVTQLTGATVRSYPLRRENGYQPDLDALERLDTRRIKIMWLNYPHMPTGAAADTEVLARLIRWATERRVLLVNDNPYSRIGTDRPFSLLQLPGAREVAVELNSLSKSHNMAGWRMGMLVGRAELIQPVLRFKSNMDSGQFKPAQLAAITALELGPDWYDHQNDIYRERRHAAEALMRRIGAEPEPGQQGMFVWARIPGTYPDAYALSDELLRRTHLFITPGGIFGEAGNRFLRSSLCSPVSVFETADARLTAANWPQPQSSPSV